MPIMTDNLENVLNLFCCDPPKAASALIPIVETLAALASGKPRIHHRDIKPTNLLYLHSETDIYIADFGCAYLGEGERITPDQRALGAWAFRPPEYSGGRVDDVTEKADVFSLGKVLWSMINGEAHVTFPGPLWFLREYDLTSICRNADGAAEAMYVIAKCCSIRPEARPSLVDLAVMLKGLSLSGTLPTATKLGAGALIKEQQQEIEYAQRRAIAGPFVARLTDDLGRAVRLLHASNPDSLRLQAWLEEWDKYPDRSSSLVEQVVVHESDAPIMNVLRRQEILFTRFYPEGMNGGLRFFAALGPMNEYHCSPRLTIEALDTGILATVEGLSAAPEKSEYGLGTMVDFLSRAIEAS